MTIIRPGMSRPEPTITARASCSTGGAERNEASMTKKQVNYCLYMDGWRTGILSYPEVFASSTYYKIGYRDGEQAYRDATRKIRELLELPNGNQNES